MKKIYEEYLEVDPRITNVEELIKMAVVECKAQIVANMERDGHFKVTKEKKENGKVEVRVKFQIED